jgi:hypothetical protein
MSCKAAGNAINLQGEAKAIIVRCASRRAGERRDAINENEFTGGLQRAGTGIVVAVINARRDDLFSRSTP